MDARDSSWIDANDYPACPLNGQHLLVPLIALSL
jgi:hypothetical protein